MTASRFGDPLWLHTPNPALADRLEAERHGSGTTGGLAATKHGRTYTGIDLSTDYLDLSLKTRLLDAGLPFGTEEVV